MSVQLVIPTRRKAKRFTPQQKLQVLREWERSRNGVEVAEKYQIHARTLYRWKESSGAGCANVSERQQAQSRSPHQEAGEREPEAEGSPGCVQKIMAVSEEKQAATEY